MNELRERIAKIMFCMQNCNFLPKYCTRKCAAKYIFKKDLKKDTSWINELTNSILADPEIKEALKLADLLSKIETPEKLKEDIDNCFLLSSQECYSIDQKMKHIPQGVHKLDFHHDLVNEVVKNHLLNLFQLSTLPATKEAGRKEGIKEVVKCVENHPFQYGSSPLIYIIEQGEWESKLQEWGIKGI